MHLVNFLLFWDILIIIFFILCLFVCKNSLYCHIFLFLFYYIYLSLVWCNNLRQSDMIVTLWKNLSRVLLLQIHLETQTKEKKKNKRFNTFLRWYIYFTKLLEESWHLHIYIYIYFFFLSSCEMHILFYSHIHV